MEKIKDLKPKERKPVPITLKIDTYADLQALTESATFKTFIFDKTLTAIKSAIRNKKNDITLFNIVNFNYLLSIDKADFKKVLESMIEFYVAQEEYEKCKEINKIIKKYEKI
jgi:hypothetical protein